MADSVDESEGVFIVAMEVGSRWPLWSDHVRIGVPHLVTIVQHAEQPLAVLVSRVLKATAAARQRNQKVQTLAIACNGRCDRNALVARAQIAKSALADMAPGGRVLLTADDNVPDPARHVLETLAKAVADSAPRDISVEVSFGKFRSGLFPVADVVPAEETREEVSNA